jgi:hypothetical protein
MTRDDPRGADEHSPAWRDGEVAVRLDAVAKHYPGGVYAMRDVSVYGQAEGEREGDGWPVVGVARGDPSLGLLALVVVVAGGLPVDGDRSVLDSADLQAGLPAGGLKLPKSPR